MSIAQIEAAVEAAVRRALHEASPPPPSPLIGHADAAVFLGVSERTLYDLVRAGEVPYVAVGASRRFAVEALRRYIATNSKRGV